MPWLHASPCHQQPWYWLCRIVMSLYYMRKDFQSLCHLYAEQCMMTSSNGNIFHVTGRLCGEFTGDRWIPRTKASDAELGLFSLICAWINAYVKNREAGDVKRLRAHYDVTVMEMKCKYVLQFFKTICATSLCSNDIECKYMFTFHLNNSVRKELSKTTRWR